MPTFNEAGNVPAMCERLRAAVPEASLLIVDDDSPDGTGAVADALARRFDRVHVLHRTEKEGLGAAYLAGFAWAAAHGYDVVIEMDADGSHAPEQLPRLLAALTDADLVLGSRWIAGGEVLNWPRNRKVLSRGGNAFARIVLGLPLSDATGGYRAYRREVLDSLPLHEVRSQGYCFQVELAWRTWKAGYRVAEVPITFVERERGESKMSNRIVFEALTRVTWWGVRALPARARNELRRPDRADRTVLDGPEPVTGTREDA